MYMVGKLVVMFCLITSEVLKLEGVEKLVRSYLLTADPLVKRKFVIVQKCSFFPLISQVKVGMSHIR